MKLFITACFAMLLGCASLYIHAQNKKTDPAPKADAAANAAPKADPAAKQDANAKALAAAKPTAGKGAGAKPADTAKPNGKDHPAGDHTDSSNGHTGTAHPSDGVSGSL